uniref:UDP-N-acetylglucosamine transporter TMEM241 isoform X2 n=1 Tax=Myxine glutinosa TaxID=7769 RepID=UPI00358EC1BF
MRPRHVVLVLSYCAVYVAVTLTNKYVLSSLHFTYPTLFQGWQTLIGALLLFTCGQFGLVDLRQLSSVSSRTVLVPWLPGSLLYIGMIYCGSRAMSQLPIPVFLALQSVSELVRILTTAVIYGKSISLPQLPGLLLVALSLCLPFSEPQLDVQACRWAMYHCICTGLYKTFQLSKKALPLSDFDQHYINCIVSVVVLLLASQPLGDTAEALRFPLLKLRRFHVAFAASGLLVFLLMLMSIWIQEQFSATTVSLSLITAKITRRTSGIRQSYLCIIRMSSQMASKIHHINGTTLSVAGEYLEKWVNFISPSPTQREMGFCNHFCNCVSVWAIPFFLPFEFCHQTFTKALL